MGTLRSCTQPAAHTTKMLPRQHAINPAMAKSATIPTAGAAAVGVVRGQTHHLLEPCWRRQPYARQLVGDGVALRGDGGEGCSWCGSERGGGRGGSKLGGLNPRPLRETRPTGSAGAEFPEPASSPGRRRLSCSRTIR